VLVWPLRDSSNRRAQAGRTRCVTRPLHRSTQRQFGAYALMRDPALDQVWSGEPKRNASGSTATSVADHSSSHGDSGYRSMSEGGWRSSGGWEEVGNNVSVADPVQFVGDPFVWLC
jgi:hypothetical protein